MGLPELLILIYVIGALITVRVTFRYTLNEFGTIDDFGDFSAVAFLLFCEALVWPLFALFYGVYVVWLRHSSPQ